MCGIIAYAGPLDAKKIILEGLEQLEYRGYDSAGIALMTDNNEIFCMRETGQVAFLKESVEKESVISHCGIGHTRWATHGGVTQTNAHPHTMGFVTLIHNGIIENYQKLIRQFDMSDMLKSQTDTEVAAYLLNRFYGEGGHDPIYALKKTIEHLEGTFAFCILFSDRPGHVFCVRNVSPLVAAYSTENGSFIASDLTALLEYTKEYFVVPEYVICDICKDGITLLNLDTGENVEPEILAVTWDYEAAKKGGYPFFMIKEIMEQPDAFLKTVTPRISDGIPDFSGEEKPVPDEVLSVCKRVDIVACGTAMHAGMVARALLEPMLNISCNIKTASEYRYEMPLMNEQTLTILISQSGETIDTLEALRLAKSKGSTTISVVNVKGSTIARESDYVIYTHAGPEIAVASTKAYTVQIAALYLIICRMALAKGLMSRKDAESFVCALIKAVDAEKKVLDDLRPEKHVSECFASAKNAFFIGRGSDYAFSLEGALKLKEISYIHAEAYAAGELKHGTIALIEEGTPVIATATQSHIFNKTISNIQEVKSRGAFVVLITREDAEVDSSIYDIRIDIPNLEDCFTVFPVAVIMQLIAYYTSDEKGLDVDKPRNLAKSVTVE